MSTAQGSRGRFVDKVAVVTGGGGGLGSAICRRLATEGALVVVAERDTRAGEAIAASLTAAGHQARFLPVDISDQESVDALSTAVRTDHGAASLLVNCAALYAELARLPFWEIRDGDFSRVMEVNIVGAFRVTKAFTEQLAASGHGRVVMIASVVPYRGTPHILHYVTSKAAMLGMTRAMARELGPRGVTVNAVAPGMVDTDSSRRSASTEFMKQLAQERAIARTQTPDDVVGAVAWLCSEDAAFVTGQTVIVDGGVVFT